MFHASVADGRWHLLVVIRLRDGVRALIGRTGLSRCG